MHKSKGLGDDIAFITEKTGIKKVVKAVTEAVGIDDCGCDSRQEKLNVLPSILNGIRKDS
jgi:hypothetical protein